MFGIRCTIIERAYIAIATTQTHINYCCYLRVGLSASRKRNLCCKWPWSGAWTQDLSVHNPVLWPLGHQQPPYLNMLFVYTLDYTGRRRLYWGLMYGGPCGLEIYCTHLENIVQSISHVYSYIFKHSCTHNIIHYTSHKDTPPHLSMADVIHVIIQLETP